MPAACCLPRARCSELVLHASSSIGCRRGLTHQMLLGWAPDSVPLWGCRLPPESSLLLWGAEGLAWVGALAAFRLLTLPGCAQYLLRPELRVCLVTSMETEVSIYFFSKCFIFLPGSLLNCPQLENSPFACHGFGRVFIGFILSDGSQCILSRNPAWAFIFSSTGKWLFERLLGELLCNNICKSICAGRPRASNSDQLLSDVNLFGQQEMKKFC